MGAVAASSTSVHELLAFSRVLQPSDVETLYGGGFGYVGTTNSGPCASGLIAGYHFSEGSGTTTADFSGHGHTGTLSGGASLTADTANLTFVSYTPTSALTVGTHHITADYQPGNYTARTLAELDQQIDPDFSFAGPAAAMPYSNYLTYTAAIIPDANNDAPTGHFTFSINGGSSYNLDPVHAASPVATFAGEPAGTYTLTVSFSGDLHYPACTLTRTLVVSSAPGIQSDATVTGETPGRKTGHL